MWLTLEEALSELSKEVENPFTGTTQFYCTGASEISLPPGTYGVKVYKGIEYRASLGELEITADQRVQREVRLTRWINMAEKGWYSADDHLQISRPVEGVNPYISKMMQAEDVNVSNLLQFGLARRFHNCVQYAHGPDGPYREGDYILATGQENPRTHFLGHVVTLGSYSPINFSEEYLIYRRFFEEVRRRQALSGFAHFATEKLGGQWGLAVVLPHHLVDFIEVFQFNRPVYSTWYDVLNLGFRVTAIAGTDYPCAAAAIPGRERFYTKVDGELTYDGWLESVRAGKTFVTNGPILEFSVDGIDMGGEIALDSPASVTVAGRVLFDPSRDDIERLELVENGAAVRSFPRVNDSGEIGFQIEHPVQENCWLAIRASGVKVGEIFRPSLHRPSELSSGAHSAPVHVALSGSPPLSAHPRAQEVMRRWLAKLEDLETRLQEDNIEALASRLAVSTGDLTDGEVLGRDRSALVEEVREAMSFFTSGQE